MCAQQPLEASVYSSEVPSPLLNNMVADRTAHTLRKYESSNNLHTKQNQVLLQTIANTSPLYYSHIIIKTTFANILLLLSLCYLWKRIWHIYNQDSTLKMIIIKRLKITNEWLNLLYKTLFCWCLSLPVATSSEGMFDGWEKLPADSVHPGWSSRRNALHETKMTTMLGDS